MNSLLMAFLDVFKSYYSNKGIIYKMVKREIQANYKGSVMGLAWSFFNPILLLIVYTYIFGVVFKSRWGTSQSGDMSEFAITIFTGMIINNFFSECFNRAPRLITGNPNYVKKIVFPIEILSWISIGNGIFNVIVSCIVLFIAEIIFKGYIPITAILFPIILLPFILFIMGLSWFLAAIGVYLRDISQITSILTTVLMFLSPLFYPISAISEKYRDLLYFNPLTYVIETTRGLLIWSAIPDIYSLCLYYLFSIIVATFGYLTFQKIKHGFADVL